MIDHIGFPVSDYVTSKLFYERTLAPLGYEMIVEIDKNEMGAPAAGFGIGDNPDFWIGGEGGVGNPLHVAITARDRAAVDAFYREGIAAGGKDNGAPGLRPQYGPHYYAAFVLDPDGNNIEAVCYQPE